MEKAVKNQFEELQELIMEKHTPYTDSYFIRTRKIVQEKGDAKVTYAIFMRRPVTYAPKLALNWLQKVISD